MTDIYLTVSDDYTLDWDDPIKLAVDPDNTLMDDITNMVYASLCTDRVVDLAHQLSVGTDRHGCWQDTYVGEFGSLFWLAMQGYIDTNSMLSTVEAYAQQALQWIYEDNWITQPAVVTAQYKSQDSIALYISVIAADGTAGKISYVLG
jgi:phage gp46-like protein